MLRAEESLEFILDQVENLGQGARPDEKAAYRALIHMTQRWAEPTDLFVHEDLYPTTSCRRNDPWDS